ncbi:Putative metallopeptidase domain-containing protein [Fibrobacter sp. UWR3]|uniref:VWA-like domain-containing protein n=1 Tax=unclassified Fibrobacter TaxID=2634177 RepID=UPI00091E62A8|nr:MULTISPECIES: VWA-like domain-containing protein [unclassified Fibrobacter]SHM90650.1 Putative metallopeptidase domain-containing protein [Fibrobacter sp. UWR3]SOE75916.1 Putative metallopeptidase domain-containing protein [Fibrobacter sp. UWT3]
MNALDRIKKISERWFLTEPLLFAVYCSHEFVENSAIEVPMRTGNMKIEFAPKILDKIADDVLVEYLKIEMFRILLKHPYQRQPSFAAKALLTMASNITIADVYDVSREVKKQMSGTEQKLPGGLCFEEYYNLLLQNTTPNSGKSGGEPQKTDSGPGQGDKSGQGGDDSGNGNQEGGESGQQGGDGSGADSGDASGDSRGNGSGSKGNSRGSSGRDGGGSGGKGSGASGNSGAGNSQEHRDSQISELWEDNEEACCNINEFIEVATASNNWGTVAGKLQGLIKASLKVDMDYRKMLSLFKTSVISSRRRLTRMRPNRRSGFDAMGSRYELSTNLLIAVDVSGSVTDKSLQFFFSVINRLFKYGVEKLDVLQFDAQIQGEIEPLKKARKTVKIMGRGGTSFQPAADYYCEHPEYDGLIYFTDGYAPPPVFNTKRPIDVLWVICSRQCYAENAEWIRKMKRNRVTFIPRSE